MKITRGDKKIIIKINDDAERASLQDLKDEGIIDTDDARFDFFENQLANCEFEWLSPGFDLDVLTDAPILGVKDENDEVIECYGFMDYAVRSLLGDLYEYGEAILRKGEE